MREMTITEGLVELKTLDSRIEKAMSKEFIGYSKNSDKGSDAWKDFEERARANFRSVIDLINERAKIKSAIVKSNAETEVMVADKKMTVAEAIERKSSISYEEALLDRLKRNYANATTSVEVKSTDVQRKLDSLMETLVGSDKKVDIDEQKKTAEMYIERNGYSLVDPLNLQNVIDTLENNISAFKANVDVALSVSNARTVITIE